VRLLGPGFRTGLAWLVKDFLEILRVDDRATGLACDERRSQNIENRSIGYDAPSEYVWATILQQRRRGYIARAEGVVDHMGGRVINVFWGFS